MEPFYESYSITNTYAKNAILNSWFCKQMRMTFNTYESNQNLASLICELKEQGTYRAIGRGNPNAGNHIVDKQEQIRMAASNATRVTFESLRYNTPDWEQQLTNLVTEVVNHEQRKNGGLGSERGFYTFVFQTTCNTVLARVILEMWAIPIIKRRLKRYVRAFIERRFTPGATGFMESQCNFNELVSRSYHQGEENNEFIDLPSPPKLVRQNAMNF